MAAPAEANRTASQPESASSTLQTTVELVRHIMHADVASIVSFSLTENTITWKAASGLRAHVIDDEHPLIQPITNEVARRSIAANRTSVVEGLGVRDEFPAKDFVIHAAEGVRDFAFTPLKARGEMLGALIIAYRSPHPFTDEDKQRLENLAALAALALDNKRLLETVSAAEERIRLVVEAAPSAMLMVNNHGRIALVNAQTEKLFGYSRTELLGQPVELLVPQRYGTAHPGHRAEFFHQPSARPMGASRDLYGRHKDGSEVPIEIGLNPIRTDEGLFVLADIIDITKRKETEDTLRQSEARAQRGKRIWEKTFDAIGEGILVHDSQMRIVRCNTQAAEMLGVTPAEVIGLKFSEAFARLFGKQAADYYLDEGREVLSSFEAQTASGQRYLVSIFPIKNPDGDSVSVVMWNDVTTLSEVQEQLGRSRRLASVGQLAAGVAHEVNNPLAAITTCAEAVMRDINQSDTAKELATSRQWNYYLEEIVRQSLRCKEITRGLLDLTRQRQARRILIDINSVVKQCAKTGVQRAGSKAEFQVHLDENIGEVATDAEMLRQILDNLIGNAIDALGEQPGSVTVSTLREGDRIAIEIADSGQGIPADLLSKIFDPFFSTKGPGKGYGLGLAICLSLAESLGGGITVQTKEGDGSRFRVWIPRRSPEE